MDTKEFEEHLERYKSNCEEYYLILDTSDSAANDVLEKEDIEKNKLIIPIEVLKELKNNEHQLQPKSARINETREYLKMKRIAERYIKRTQKYKQSRIIIKKIKEAIERRLPKDMDELKNSVPITFITVLDNAANDVKKESKGRLYFPVYPTPTGSARKQQKAISVFEKYLKEFIDAVITRIEQTEGLSPADIAVVASTLFILKNKPNARVKVLANDSHIRDALRGWGFLLKGFTKRIEYLPVT
jgi:hypothetical protein